MSKLVILLSFILGIALVVVMFTYKPVVHTQCKYANDFIGPIEQGECRSQN